MKIILDENEVLTALNVCKKSMNDTCKGCPLCELENCIKILCENALDYIGDLKHDIAKLEAKK